MFIYKLSVMSTQVSFIFANKYSSHLLSTYPRPESALSTLCRLSHLILTSAPWGTTCYCRPQMSDEETESQRGYRMATCLITQVSQIQHRIDLAPRLALLSVTKAAFRPDARTDVCSAHLGRALHMAQGWRSIFPPPGPLSQLRRRDTACWESCSRYL